jgi:hypothetical protein
MLIDTAADRFAVHIEAVRGYSHRTAVARHSSRRARGRRNKRRGVGGRGQLLSLAACATRMDIYEPFSRVSAVLEALEKQSPRER